MTDIVWQLRNFIREYWSTLPDAAEHVVARAADRIEAQDVEIVRLRAALEDIAFDARYGKPSVICEIFELKANKALNKR